MQEKAQEKNKEKKLSAKKLRKLEEKKKQERRQKIFYCLVGAGLFACGVLVGSNYEKIAAFLSGEPEKPKGIFSFLSE